MLLSILIPTYNRSRELKRCLDSVLAQNYNNEFTGKIEVIVQDNASPDNTKEVIENFKTLGGGIIKAFYNTDNIRGYNIVEVAKNATGKYVMYLTDDDYMLPGSLKEILSFLDSNDYDFIRLNLITFLEKSIGVFCHCSLRKNIDKDNSTMKEKAIVLSSTNTLTGNILKREKIDIQYMYDMTEQWYPHIAAIGKMSDNFVYIPYVYLMHTWENEVYWGDVNVHDYNKYREPTAGFYNTFIDLRSSIGDDLLKEIIYINNPNKKFYKFAYKLLTNRQKLGLLRINIFSKLKKLAILILKR